MNPLSLKMRAIGLLSQREHSLVEMRRKLLRISRNMAVSSVQSKQAFFVVQFDTTSTAIERIPFSVIDSRLDGAVDAHRVIMRRRSTKTECAEKQDVWGKGPSYTVSGHKFSAHFVAV